MRKLALAVLHLSGLFAFLAPFAIGTLRSAPDRSADAPWLLAILGPLLVVMVIAESSAGKLDSKRIALLGALAAFAAVMRVPVSFAGANLFFVVPVLGSIVYGSSFGFLLGATGMGASALLTGGIGPWLPFQMWAAGWICAAAGALRPLADRFARSKLLTAALAGAFGYAAAFAYGLIINLHFWPLLTSGESGISWQPGIGFSETLSRYLAFYSLTSLPWDAIGALFNLVVFAAAAPGATQLLRRYRNRLSFEYSPATPQTSSESAPPLPTASHSFSRS